MADSFWAKVTKWLRYARKHPWQAVGLLMFLTIPTVVFHLFLRQVEDWEDEFIRKHGDSQGPYIVTGLVDFLARHPVWSIGIFAVSVVLALLIHAYISTHPYFDFEKETASSIPSGMNTTDSLPAVIPMRKSLPEHRPHVVPSAYKRKSRGSPSFGLFVVNPGYMALDIHIPSVPIGGESMYTLVFHERLAQLGERPYALP